MPVSLQAAFLLQAPSLVTHLCPWHTHPVFVAQQWTLHTWLSTKTPESGHYMDFRRILEHFNYFKILRVHTMHTLTHKCVKCVGTHRDQKRGSGPGALESPAIVDAGT